MNAKCWCKRTSHASVQISWVAVWPQDDRNVKDNAFKFVMSSRHTCTTTLIQNRDSWCSIIDLRALAPLAWKIPACFRDYWKLLYHTYTLDSRAIRVELCYYHHRALELTTFCFRFVFGCFLFLLFFSRVGISVVVACDHGTSCCMYLSQIFYNSGRKATNSIRTYYNVLSY